MGEAGTERQRRKKKTDWDRHEEDKRRGRETESINNNQYRNHLACNLLDNLIKLAQYAT